MLHVREQLYSQRISPLFNFQHIGKYSNATTLSEVRNY